MTHLPTLAYGPAAPAAKYEALEAAALTEMAYVVTSLEADWVGPVLAARGRTYPAYPSEIPRGTVVNFLRAGQAAASALLAQELVAGASFLGTETGTVGVCQFADLAGKLWSEGDAMRRRQMRLGAIMDAARLALPSGDATPSLVAWAKAPVRDMEKSWRAEILLLAAVRARSEALLANSLGDFGYIPNFHLVFQACAKSGWLRGTTVAAGQLVAKGPPAVSWLLDEAQNYRAFDGQLIFNEPTRLGLRRAAAGVYEGRSDCLPDVRLAGLLESLRSMQEGPPSLYRGVTAANPLGRKQERPLEQQTFMPGF
jgi:hypothetical protein